MTGGGPGAGGVGLTVDCIVACTGLTGSGVMGAGCTGAGGACGANCGDGTMRGEGACGRGDGACTDLHGCGDTCGGGVGASLISAREGVTSRCLGRVSSTGVVTLCLSGGGVVIDLMGSDIGLFSIGDVTPILVGVGVLFGMTSFLSGVGFLVST